MSHIKDLYKNKKGIELGYKHAKFHIHRPCLSVLRIIGWGVIMLPPFPCGEINL